MNIVQGLVSTLVTGLVICDDGNFNGFSRLSQETSKKKFGLK